MADDASPRDYRETVFLPDTPFPMRAGLPQKEPQTLEHWSQMGLYQAMRRARQDAGAPLFVLHDGPPYANGAIHIGHALNKLLKDFVVRSRFLLGYDVDYVPGWDCHGLPIEWKIEEAYRAKGKRKDEVPTAEFRAECRAYAAKWIDVQRDEFKRLGVLGDWDHRYATMDFGSEATIVGEFHKFLMSGQLYRGSKPVMWSPVERTALADAEVEYANHTSPTIWVKFPVKTWDRVYTQQEGMTQAEVTARLPDTSLVIWTTTPWTIPANRAVSYSPEIDYRIYTVEALAEDLGYEPWAKVGERLIIAQKLAESVMKAAGVARWSETGTMDVSGVTLNHPLHALDAGYGFDVPMLAGDHVTDDAGTGFVHTAPGHGADDYQVWLDTGRSREDIPDTVDPEGAYFPHVPLFAGLKVLETEGKKTGKFGPANGAVMEKLIEAGNLLARGRLEHSYPHSWRSKAPVIFRNTPQWFIRMDQPLGDGTTLRSRALKAIADTAFYPDAGRNRIGSMVENRPDWLISRQRAWGTPLAMYVDKATGEPLKDEAVNARILAAIREGGADAWFVRPDAEFLGDGYDPDKFEKVEDILDVWFDSGSTHAFTLEDRDPTQLPTKWPADLYLEGSDQHRGWFQSSLLEGCGTRGRAPYDGILTHGFTLDEQGEKMSKSKGNTIEPQTIIKESGAEILRLWVAMVDYADDQRIGKTILQTVIDGYRKLRNTLRYLLGALAGFEPAEAVAYADMPPLERFILHRLWELDRDVRAAYEAYDFQTVFRLCGDFCSADLSALYFDVRRDALYCDRPDGLRRRAVRTVMDAAFERLTAWLAPLAAFTAEEAWTTRFPEAGPVGLRVMPATPAEWENPAEAARWAKVDEVVRAVTGALEVERREKRIGSALEAAPQVTATADQVAAFDGLDAAEVFRTSSASLSVGELSVRPFLAEGEKCARCWRILTEVKAPAMLCERCDDAVAAWDAAH
ncbi:MAG: isoleucine--tRNA ligase [Caulobacterales bacterium 68-7]|mgnify:CR=1 FL=1|nr:MAG: isoleucine--tRNA ligase [Caulobacterales bacterium 68-7]